MSGINLLSFAEFYLIVFVFYLLYLRNCTNINRHMGRQHFMQDERPAISLTEIL